MWTVSDCDTYAVLCRPDGTPAARFHVIAEAREACRALNEAAAEMPASASPRSREAAMPVDTSKEAAERLAGLCGPKPISPGLWSLFLDWHDAKLGAETTHAANRIDEELTAIADTLRALVAERDAAEGKLGYSVLDAEAQRQAAAEFRAELDAARTENARLREGLIEARSLIDRHMGDTDPQDPEHPLLLACQRISAALGGGAA